MLTSLLHWQVDQEVRTPDCTRDDPRKWLESVVGGHRADSQRPAQEARVLARNPSLCHGSILGASHECILWCFCDLAETLGRHCHCLGCVDEQTGFQKSHTNQWRVVVEHGEGADSVQETQLELGELHQVCKLLLVVLAEGLYLSQSC